MPETSPTNQPHLPDEAWWAALLVDEDQHTSDAPYTLSASRSARPKTGADSAVRETPPGYAPVKSQTVSENLLLDVNWPEAERLFQRDETVCLEVVGCNCGGLLVEMEGLCGFVPVSHLVDVSPHSNEAERCGILEQYVGQELCLKIIECDPERSRVVFSQRAAQAGAGQRNRLFGSIQPGDRTTGKVTNLTKFGAFIELGGVEGLIHVSELSWGRVRHPSDILGVGDEVEALVLTVDKERGRVALSLKRLIPNPWETAEARYHSGDEYDAVITSMAPFGAFARLEEGLDGLIHNSVLDGTGADHCPADALREGQHVRVRILHVDASRQRMGLGLCQGE
jgi:small subunit ribosomal protein S1